MSKREKIIKQVELMDEIRSKTNINLVNCGNCGKVLLHRLSDEQVECPYCGLVSDPCDFPDLLYIGCEDSPIYDEEETE